MAQVNMGQRRQYATRLPAEVAELFEADARAAELPYSQYLADLVAEHYGRQRPSVRFATKKRMRRRDQEVLPLDRAS